jgi:hypothetical protein
MKKLFILVLSCAMYTGTHIQAQDSLYVGNSFGVGLGMDYGGVGMRYTYSANRTIGIFGAAGYNLVDLGLNAGLIARFNPGQKTCVYGIGMYGYNGVIKVEGASEYNKTYYGPTFGLGIEFHARNKTQNFFNVELLVPLRPSSFQDDIDDLKNDNIAEFKNEPMPIAISLGYHFGR